MVSLRGAVVAALVMLSACGADEPIRQLPADVDAVIQARCRRCHGDPTAFFAPMSMVTWNDMHERSPGSDDKRVYQVLGGRIDNVDFPMPPYRTSENDAFTEAERELLRGWVNAGAPPAPELDAGVP